MHAESKRLQMHRSGARAHPLQRLQLLRDAWVGHVQAHAPLQAGAEHALAPRQLQHAVHLLPAPAHDSSCEIHSKDDKNK